MERRKPDNRCCVVGCKINNLNSPGTKFYSFPKNPNKIEQREKWIKLLKRTNLNGPSWEPNNRSRLCSRHFIGNEKSDHPRSPNFVPSIFPFEKSWKKETEEALKHKQERFQRALRRSLSTPVDAVSSISVAVGTIEVQPTTVDIQHLDEVPLFKDEGTQVDFLDVPNECNIFICNLTKENNTCEAETQANFNYKQVRPPPKIKVADKCCGNHVEYCDSMVGPNADGDSGDSLSSCPGGFHGMSSVKKDQDLLDLGGVNFETFDLLLRILVDSSNCKIDKRNRLFIFLIKMRLGLTFSAIGVLFGVHRTTVSRIFYFVLQFLARACTNFVFWPTKQSVSFTMPEIFKKTYPDCRVIIDCTEFQVEQPPEVPQRVFFFSHYKKRFTIKILVGCTPNGMVSFVSKAFGGRTTDTQITNYSGFLELLEPGDLVLADKGFPEIKTALDDSGREILVVMPPFLINNTFTAEQVKETQHVARIRIHIERIMQRIKTFRILSKVNISELPYIDDIIFMACVLVNLQPPIIQSDKQTDVES